MADDGLRIVNTVDNSQVDSAFARMRKEIVSSAEAAQQQGRKIDDALDRVALSANATSDTLKRRIHESSQVVNELTAKIIEQRAVVKDVQADVKRLGDAYKEAKAKGTYGASGILAEYNAAKKALENEKSALFALNQEKQKASLKVQELRGQYELMKKATDDNVLSLGMLQKGFVALGGTMAVKAFTQQVIQTRGEFQQLEVAFTTMLGSAEKANALMMQLTKTAAVTPFDLKGVTDGAKQLLAYGVSADEVNDTLIHLGDIAAGLSLPLGDLVYLYGTTLTQGRMFTQDLRQFMGRGIPIAEELAKQFGVTKDKVQELVSTGKVGAEEFKQAIMAMSSEGGKFGGLMEEQSKIITGQISNIEDAIDNAFNKIGKQSEGVINTALDGVSYLVENYEKVGKIILSVAGVYGTYKAAVLAVIAVEKIMAMARLAQIKQTTLCQLATDVLTKKMALLNTTMLMNPWVLAATAIAGLIAVLMNLETEADRVREVNEEYNNTLDETIRKEEERERRVNELIGIAGDEALSTDTRIEALQKLNNKYPQIFAKYKTEYEWLTHLQEIKAEIAELDGQTSHKKATVQKQDVDARIAELEKKGHATYSTQTTMYGTVLYNQTGGRTAKEETELEELYKKREQLAKQIQKDKGDYYMTHLTGVSNEDLDAQIQERKTLLAQMQLHGTKLGLVQKGGAQGTYTADELSAQLNNLNAEKNRRNETRYTPAQRKAQLQSELTAARKALADFDNSSTKYTVAEAEKKRKELQNAVSEAEKKYKDFGGSTKEKKPAKDTRVKDEQTISSELEKISKETELSIIKNKKDGVEKQIELLDFENKQELANLEKRHSELVAKRGGNLTPEEEKVFTDAALAINENYSKRRKQIEDDSLNESTASMREFLSIYGNIEERRQALTEIAEQKIAKARTEGEKLTIAEELKSQLSSLETEALKLDINWEMLFGDLGSFTKKQLESLRKQLRGYKQSDAYVKGTEENRKIIDEAINDITATINDKGGIFGGLATAITELHDAQKELADATEELNNATTQTEKETAKKKVNSAQKRKENAQGSVAKAAESTTDKISSLANSITRLGTQSEMTLSDLGDLANDIASAFGETGKKVGGWIGAIFSIAEMVAKDGLVGLIENVGKLVGQVLGGIFGIDIDENTHYYEEQKRIHDNYIKLLNEILSDQEELLKKQAGLEAYDTYIDAKKNFSSIQRARSNDVYNYLNAGASKGFLGIGSSASNGRKLYNKLGFQNMPVMAATTGADFYKTDTYRFAKQYAEIFGISNIFSIDDRMRELGNATIEQIRALKEARELWSMLPEEVIQYYNEILEADKAMQELKDILSETITGTSFDNLLSSFENTLEQMDASAENWTDNIEATFNKAIVNSLVKSKYSDLLRAWYGSAEDGTGFAGAFKNGIDNISEKDIENFRNGYMEIVGQAQDEANRLREMFGLDYGSSYKQEASSKGFNAMGQDVGEEMNGRFTAIQIAAYDLKDLATARNEMLMRMEQNQGSVKTSVEGITDALALTNIHLSDIAKYTKHLIAMEETLDDIKNNTKHL